MADVWAAPKRFERAFPEDTRKRLYDYLNEPGWETRWKSNYKRDSYTFLRKQFAGWRYERDDERPAIYDCQDELQQNSPLIFNAWLGVRDRVFAGHRLVHCHANGIYYGMDTTVHTDAREPGGYTAIYYPHEKWSPDWGGETIFYNLEKNRVIGCMYPLPNSMVVFDGRIPHRANGVTRSYAGMRITLMWKTELMEKPNGAASL